MTPPSSKRSSPRCPHCPTLAQAARDAEPAGLADLARLLAGSGLSMGIVGSTAPASGSEHAVSHLLEMALSPATGTCSAARHAGDGRDAACAAGLAARRPHDLLGAAQVQVPDESSRRDAVALAFAELGAQDRRGVLDGLLGEAELAARAPGRRRGDGRRLGRVHSDGDAADAGTVRRREPRERTADARSDLGAGYDDDLLFWALRNSHLLRERISIVDLADLLGVWSDDTARSIVADVAKAKDEGGPMAHFVFMLTHGDRTVDDAAEIMPTLADTGLRYVGFKDVGADSPSSVSWCRLPTTPDSR